MKRLQTAAFGVTEYEIIVRGSYRPRISSAQLGQFYRLKRKTGKPISRLVGEALENYLEHMKGGDTNGNQDQAT